MSGPRETRTQRGHTNTKREYSHGARGLSWKVKREASDSSVKRQIREPSGIREQILNLNMTEKCALLPFYSPNKLFYLQAIEWPLKHPKSFARLGVTRPRGVLLRDAVKRP